MIPHPRKSTQLLFVKMLFGKIHCVTLERACQFISLQKHSLAKPQLNIVYITEQRPRSGTK